MRPTWTLAGNLRTVLLGLASGGVCPAAVSPRRRCALTAPFHPCLCETHVQPRHRRCVSVALSRGFPRVGVPTTLPCDVRTFLDGLSLPPRLLGLPHQPTGRAGAIRGAAAIAPRAGGPAAAPCPAPPEGPARESPPPAPRPDPYLAAPPAASPGRQCRPPSGRTTDGPARMRR